MCARTRQETHFSLENLQLQRERAVQKIANTFMYTCAHMRRIERMFVCVFFVAGRRNFTRIFMDALDTHARIFACHAASPVVIVVVRQCNARVAMRSSVCHTVIMIPISHTRTHFLQTCIPDVQHNRTTLRPANIACIFSADTHNGQVVGLDRAHAFLFRLDVAFFHLCCLYVALILVLFPQTHRDRVMGGWRRRLSSVIMRIVARKCSGY